MDTHSELDRESQIAGKALTDLLGAAIGRWRDPGKTVT